MSKRNPHHRVLYKGKIYKFDDGVSIRFVNLEFSLSLSKNANKMLKDVIESKILSKIEYIVDPSYYHNVT